ncbi:Acylpyruvase fahd1, mitochondrial [Balamuthia mandrillaris]
MSISGSRVNIAQFWGMGRKIVAVGRNYAEHALELGNAVPAQPLLFLKPTSSYVLEPNPIELPLGAGEVHHEVELGIVISKRGRDIKETEAMDFVGGYALALDLTCRDLQAEAKKKGTPWTVAKGYDTFCPISPFIPKSALPSAATNTTLWLKVDGIERQRGNTNQMIFSVPTLIQYISSIMTLDVGDLILTGTPSGVGPLKAGQVVTAGVEGILEMRFPVVNRKAASAESVGDQAASPTKERARL